MTIHKLSGTDELADFRTSMKILAQIIRNRPEVKLLDRRHTLRRVTEKVCEGNPTVRELEKWYPKAVALGRGTLERSK